MVRRPQSTVCRIFDHQLPTDSKLATTEHLRAGWRCEAETVRSGWPSICSFRICGGRGARESLAQARIFCWLDKPNQRGSNLPTLSWSRLWATAVGICVMLLIGEQPAAAADLSRIET